MTYRLEIFQFPTNSSALTKHEQNLKGSNIKLLDFVSFLQKVTLNPKSTEGGGGVLFLIFLLLGVRKHLITFF